MSEHALVLSTQKASAERRERTSQFKSAKIGDNAPSASGSYEPSAQGTPPDATRDDMFSPECSFTHVLTGAGEPDGDFSIKPLSNVARGTNWKPMSKSESASPVQCVVFLNPKQLDQAREGSLKLPALAADRLVYLPVSACVAKLDGTCVADAEKLEIADPDQLFSRLKWNVGKVSSLSSKSTAPAVVYQAYRTTYAFLFPQGSHPGNNTHIQGMVDDALSVYKRSNRSPKNMADFVKTFQVADCDMTALAVAQVSRERRVIIAFGNRPVTSNVIDASTQNHAWNLLLMDNSENGDVGIASLDDTFVINTAFEYYADASFRRRTVEEFASYLRANKAWRFNYGAVISLYGVEKSVAFDPASVRREALQNSPAGDLIGLSRDQLIDMATIVTPFKVSDRNWLGMIGTFGDWEGVYGDFSSRRSYGTFVAKWDNFELRDGWILNVDDAALCKGRTRSHYSPALKVLNAGYANPLSNNRRYFVPASVVSFRLAVDCAPTAGGGFSKADETVSFSASDAGVTKTKLLKGVIYLDRSAL